jgi:hypothetical protein
MRSLTFAVAVLSIVSGLSGASNGPFFDLKQTIKDGTLFVTGKNISRSPLVAYVVVAEGAHQRSVWHGVYSGGDTLGVAQTVRVGEAAAGSPSEPLKVFVDYVRLADGTSWGDATTDDAKEIAARFQK